MNEQTDPLDLPDSETGEGDNSQPDDSGDESAPLVTEQMDPADSEDEEESGGSDSDPDQPALTPGQAASVQAVTQAASIVARSTAAVFPTTWAADYISGLGPGYVCPQLDATQDFDVLNLTFDYGNGCGTATFPGTLMKGRVVGKFFFNVNAMDMKLESFDADGNALDGTVSGGFAVSAHTATFALNVNLTDAGGLVANGGATVVVDIESGAISVSTATISIHEGGADPIVVLFDNLMIDPAESSAFLPHSGAASFDLADGTGEPTKLDVTFNADTPTGGSATVSVDYGDPIGVTLGE